MTVSPTSIQSSSLYQQTLTFTFCCFSSLLNMSVEQLLNFEFDFDFDFQSVKKERSNQLSDHEQWEMSNFLMDNPYVTADDAAILSKGSEI